MAGLSAARKAAYATLTLARERDAYVRELVNGANSPLAKLNDAERWDLIEHYFLGHDDEVCARLGMTDQAAAVEVELVGQTPAAQAPVPTQAA